MTQTTKEVLKSVIITLNYLINKWGMIRSAPHFKKGIQNAILEKF